MIININNEKKKKEEETAQILHDSNFQEPILIKKKREEILK